MNTFKRIVSNPLFPWALSLGVLYFIFKDLIHGIDLNSRFSTNSKDLNHTDKLDDSKSNLSDLQSLSYADSLYTAMADNGTDEESIDRIFKLIGNQYNFNKVFNSFKLRVYLPFAGEGNGVFGQYYNLSFWLNNELTISDKKILKSKHDWITFF